MKINKKIFAALIAILLVFNGCDLAKGLSGISVKVSTFTADKKAITAGDTVTFTMTGTTKDSSTSNSATDYSVKLAISDGTSDLWNGSVGSAVVASTGFNETAKVVFSKAGTFNVKLTATASDGQSATSDSITITVAEKIIVPSEFTVKFDTLVSTVTAPAAQTVKSGEKATYKLVSRTGYYFDGWYTTNTFTTKWDFTKNTVTKDITLYANWIKYGKSAVASDYVSYSSNLSTASETITIPKGEAYWVRTVITYNTILAISKESSSSVVNYTICDADGKALTNVASIPNWTYYHYYNTIAAGTVTIKLEGNSTSDVTIKLKVGQKPN